MNTAILKKINSWIEFTSLLSGLNKKEKGDAFEELTLHYLRLNPTYLTHDLAPLITELRGLIHSARHAVATTVNTLQVMTNFEIGRRIVEHEQQGAQRAEYGKELLKVLSAQLTEEFGKGFSKANLEYMRRFYLEWRHRNPRIAQKSSGQLPKSQKSQTPADILPTIKILQKPSAKSLFTLSWSHYVLLLTNKNPDERSFYEIESTQSGWSLLRQKLQDWTGSCA